MCGWAAGRNPLKGLSRDPAKPDLMEKVDVVRSEQRRRLQARQQQLDVGCERAVGEEAADLCRSVWML